MLKTYFEKVFWPMRMSLLAHAVRAGDAEKFYNMNMNPVYEKHYVVPKEDTDQFGHVNNVVYVRWISDLAGEHSAERGWSAERLIALGQGWVVRRHEVDYLNQARAGEELILRTWVAELTRASSLRRFEAIRPSDGRTIIKSATRWAWIDYKTGRPVRVPPEVSEGFTILPDPKAE